MFILKIQNIWVFERISGEQGIVIAKNRELAIKKLKNVYKDVDEALDRDEMFLYRADSEENYGDVYILRTGISQR